MGNTPQTERIKYNNPTLCAACGGLCCKNYAGIYAPQDFKQPITKAFILKLLNEGKTSVDWWEGDARNKTMSILGLQFSKINPNNGLMRTCFLRPRHVGEPAIKASWGGVCVNHSAQHGCSLKQSERPYQCRKLVPDFERVSKKKIVYKCMQPDKDKADKQQMALRWVKYQDIIEQAIIEYKNQIK